MQWARLLRYGFPCIADPPHTAIATTTPRFKSPSATVSRIIDSTVIPYVVGPMVSRKILWMGWVPCTADGVVTVALARFGGVVFA